MKIGGFLPESYQDYEKGLSSVIFTSGCSYKCPACHNKKLVFGEAVYDNGEILERLERKKKYVDKVVVSGGEPLIQLDVVPFLRELKQRGFDVKLDTNGSRPEILEDILQEKLVDYVAMDVKGPKELYSKIAGVDADVDDVEKSMRILSGSGIDYEFRTTIAPALIPHLDSRLYIASEILPNWLPPESYENMAKWIVNATGSNKHKYYLQKFVARSEEEMVDERFGKENLLKEMCGTPNDLMNKVQEAVVKYLVNCKIR